MTQNETHQLQKSKILITEAHSIVKLVNEKISKKYEALTDDQKKKSIAISAYSNIVELDYIESYCNESIEKLNSLTQ
jgi:histidinol dehydrogenase